VTSGLVNTSDHPQRTVALPVALLRPTLALSSGFEIEAAPPENLPDSDASLSRAHNATDLAGLQLREGFRIGALSLMIRYEAGSELTDLPPSYSLPNAPDWFLGMANLHGSLVPVFDLARYVGVQSTLGVKPMLLVIGHGADAAGAVIDGLPERLRFDDEQRIDGSFVPLALQGCIAGVCLIGEHAWLDLDPPALLARLEGELSG
jgi:twitching motility protein PilI